MNIKNPHGRYFKTMGAQKLRLLKLLIFKNPNHHEAAGVLAALEAPPRRRAGLLSSPDEPDEA